MQQTCARSADSDTARPEAGGCHFALVCRALEIIDEARAPLSLDALAERLAVSPAHFQKVFSRWVGVGPDRWQQYLAPGQARAMLARRHMTLDAAVAVGLPGPGRRHAAPVRRDVRRDALTPGDRARRGEGLVIRHGWFASRYGPVLAMATGRGLCALGLGVQVGRDACLRDLAGRWPAARFVHDREAVRPWFEAALGGGGAQVPLHVMGAPFQIRVWEALLRIPEGRVSTYADIARAIGRPGAVRAVGTAVGKNPLALLIPCHRVLRRSGGVGGYRWGVGVKRALLVREMAREDGPRG